MFRHIVSLTYKPMLMHYLSKTRTYRHTGIRLEIPAQVFHPGFFFSTRLLLRFILRLPLEGKRFLELGAGSGLISIKAAKKGGIVTATDINPVAIEALKKNSHQNRVPISIIQSNLFDDIPQQVFDMIAINPPYYKQTPRSLKEYAWFCGENGEYFETLFRDIGSYMHEESALYMVLFEGCDLELIENLAIQNGFHFQRVLVSNNLLEKNFIFKIEKNL